MTVAKKVLTAATIAALLGSSQIGKGDVPVKSLKNYDKTPIERVDNDKRSQQKKIEVYGDKGKGNGKDLALRGDDKDQKAWGLGDVVDKSGTKNIDYLFANFKEGDQIPTTQTKGANVKSEFDYSFKLKITPMKRKDSVIVEVNRAGYPKPITGKTIITTELENIMPGVKNPALPSEENIETRVVAGDKTVILPHGANGIIIVNGMKVETTNGVETGHTIDISSYRTDEPVGEYLIEKTIELNKNGVKEEVTLMITGGSLFVIPAKGIGEGISLGIEDILKDISGSLKFTNPSKQLKILDKTLTKKGSGEDIFVIQVMNPNGKDPMTDLDGKNIYIGVYLHNPGTEDGEGGVGRLPPGTDISKK